MRGKSVRLILVSVDDGKTGNSNKYYNMDEQPDGTVLCRWGRVGGHESSGIKSAKAADKKYQEELAKGYTDVTHLRAENGGPKTVSDSSPEGQFLEQLSRFAKKSISTNYIVSSEAVTPQMVDEAQAILSQIAGKVNIHGRQQKPNPSDINDMLIRLFKVIPRRMRDVHDYLLDKDLDTDLDKAQQLLQYEQDVLDTMSGQVTLSQTSKTVQSTNLADLMGVKVSLVTDRAIIDKIRNMMGPGYDRKLKKVYKVTNIKTEDRMDNHRPRLREHKTELFWHGSRNENWFNILQTGLLIRPSGAVYTGSMFGDGIYFADQYRKSENYTSLSGSYWARGSSGMAYISLFDVLVGKQKHIHHTDYSLSHSRLEREGFDSVFAHGGADLRNNEYVVYLPDQCSVKFVLEIGS